MFFNKNKALAFVLVLSFLFHTPSGSFFFLYHHSKRDKQLHSVYIKFFPYSSLSEFETQADNLHLSFFHLLRLYQFLIFKFLKMKHIYSKSAFKKYRQSKGGSSTHYQRWAETFTEPSPGPAISRPNPPSDFTIRSDDSIIEIEDPEPCSSSSFYSGAPGELSTLSISTESPSPRSLNRDLAPTIPYAIPSCSYHHSLQIGRPPSHGLFQTTLFRPYVPTLEDFLSVGFHRSKGQAPTFIRTCSNMVLVNDAMFSHWYGISYPLRNPKHECAHFVNK